ncbi:MAG: Uma2 family endonuclease [Saprospiraceae bacterium]|nr:Uma2 family endonuclease [Saprospiraceae bacterium]
MITFQPLKRLTPAELLEFSQLNRELHCELNANGTMSLRLPPRPRYALATTTIEKALNEWNMRSGSPEGTILTTRTGFVLRNGAVRHPVLAWLQSYKMAAQTEHLIEQIPDFFIEFLTTSESLAIAHSRMSEYIGNGARLGWLLDLDNEMVYIFGQNFEQSEAHFSQKLSGEDILRGFEFNLVSLI